MVGFLQDVEIFKNSVENRKFKTLCNRTNRNAMEYNG